MPRYFFKIRDNVGLVEDFDPEGLELADITLALDEAKEGAREILAEALRSRKAVAETQIEITDANGALLRTVPIKDVLNEIAH